MHLNSAQQYPALPQLSPEKAAEFLLGAPQTIKEVRPVVWQFIGFQTPGTIFLTWQPPSRGTTFASDGYIWGDVETRFERAVGPYVR
jgi:hypothetical protein